MMVKEKTTNELFRVVVAVPSDATYAAFEISFLAKEYFHSRNLLF